MTHRTPRFAAIISATALLLGGFGTTIALAPASAAPIVTRTPVAAPAPGELQSKLTLALNTGAPRTDRAAELEAGAAGVSVVDKMSQRMAMAPGFRYTVLGPVNVQGDRANAQLQLAADGYDNFPAVPVSWRQMDGTWKLTNESLCNLAHYASITCNL